MVYRLWSFLQRLREPTKAQIAILATVGLALTIWIAIANTVDIIQVPPDGVHFELYQRKEDIHNLYFATASASWSDAPKWWVGPWNYPDVGYFRPISSMLYLFEYQRFGSDFTSYNRLSLAFHTLNAVLLFLLTASLFRHHPRARWLLGLIAVHYFATADGIMFFAIARVVSWWPAQNDILSLTFGLSCVLILDNYLFKPRKWLLACSILTMILSISTKEMGFITMPIAVALILYRRQRAISEIMGNRRVFKLFAPQAQPVVGEAMLFPHVGLALLIYRRVVIQRAWEPVYVEHANRTHGGLWDSILQAVGLRQVIVNKLINHWGGPITSLLQAHSYWQPVAAFAIAAAVAIGLRGRTPVLFIGIAAVILASICAQFIDEDGSWAAWLVDRSLLYCLTYLLAITLFLRYRKVEPAIFTGAALLAVFLPILQYGGKHYFYWPAACLAMANAAFAVCLVRWAIELRTGANWVRIRREERALQGQ